MNISKIFIDYRQLEIFILGIYSGMPMAILLGTLSIWLRESGIDIAVITTFALARCSYSLKPLWAPLTDFFRVPLLGKIGRRKSWMIMCCGAISIILYIISNTNPVNSISELYFWIIALAFFSATFDIVFDAYRIEKLPSELQTIGAANAVFGYRMGMLLISAGSLFFADIYGWQKTFIAISVLYLFAIFYILTAKEAELIQKKAEALSFASWRAIVIDPFKDFLKRDKAVIILLAVIFYKLGEAMFSAVTSPFYIDLGFSKTEIGGVVKVFGVICTIFGTYIGGYIMYKLGNFNGLIFNGIAQTITHLTFIWLHHMGYNTTALAIAVGIESISSGMGTTALVGYLSNLCNKQYSATQYALLSSAASLFNNTITFYSGTLVVAMGWDLYFILTIILAFPGIMILWYLQKYFTQKDLKK